MSAGEPLGLGGVGSELDASGLAATACQHLRLDDDRSAELLGGRPRLRGRERNASLGYGNAVAGEEFLALVLVEIHSGRFLTGRRMGARE